MSFLCATILALGSISVAVRHLPEISSISPNQEWLVTAHWINSGSFDGTGYVWDLRNTKAGRVYFHDLTGMDEVLPRRFDASWSPNSHYVALDFNYGRALQKVMVISLGTGTPQLVDPLESDSKFPLEDTLLKNDDRKSLVGFNRLLTSSNGWLNNTDLIVKIDMLGSLEDRKTRKNYTLGTTWQRTVRFDGQSFHVMTSECDSYDKEETR